MKKYPRFLILATLSIVSAVSAFAQGGPLTPPPGAPASTMRSLQEIWDKLSDIEVQNTGLQAQLEAVQTENSLLKALMLYNRYATGGSLPWQFTTLESSGAESSLVFGPDDEPTISFSHVPTSKLWIGRLIEGDWVYSVVDNTSAVLGASSLAFGPDGHPAIAYFDIGTNELKWARFDGVSWNHSVVDSSAYEFGGYSLGFLPNGQPVIVYSVRGAQVGSFNLIYAQFDGAAWSTTIVDDSGRASGTSSLAFDPAGLPTIAYQLRNLDASYELHLARFNGLSWDLTPVDQASDVGFHNSLAFGPDGNMAIAHYDFNFSALKFSQFDGITWTHTRIDTVGNVGQHPSLDFGSDGQPAIAYYDNTNRNLKFARFTGTHWNLSVVDAIGDVGLLPSLAFGFNGLPAISYFDLTNATLKFARMGLPTATP